MAADQAAIPVATQTTDSAPATQRIDMRRAIAVFTLVGVVAINIMIAVATMRLHDQALDTAARESDNLTQVLVEHASQAMGAVDQTLKGVDDALTAELLAGPAGDDRVAAVLRRYIASLPQAIGLLVTDAEGNIRHSVSSSIAFDPLQSDALLCAGVEPGMARIKHPDSASGVLHVGVIDLRDGCPARVVISRRMEDGGKILPEAAAVVIRPSYFQAFYNTLATGKKGATGLWDTTGLLIAGTGPLAAAAGKRFQPHTALIDGGPAVRNGIQRIVSRVDQRELIISFRAVPRLPLFVSSGRSIDELLADWYDQLWTATGVAVTITLAVVLMALMLNRIAAQSEAASNALRENEQRFRDFAAASSDWIWEQNENLRFTYISPHAGRHSGMAAQQHIGKTRRELGGLGPTEEEWNEHEAILRARKPFKDFRLQRILPDGSIRYMSMNGVPVFDAAGRFKGYRGTGHDITAEMQARQAMQTVIDAVPAMINAKDLNSRYAMMNAYQAKLYGTTPRAAVGKTAANFLGGSYGGYTRGRDQQVIESGKPLDYFEERYAAVDGVERDWLTTKVPLFDALGRVNRVMTVSMDITAQKAVERRLIDARADLQSAKDAAEDANRAKTNFLANMSHELRTPLNAILGFSEMMAHEMLGPHTQAKYREFSDGIHRSGTMLLQHINDVLDMAKIEAGRRELYPEWFDVTDAANDASLVIRQRAIDAGVSLRINVPGTVPQAHADRRAVGQILVNLLSNAVKFTPRGGAVTLDVDWSVDRFTLKVSDTGVGIAPDMLELLGTPFFQVQHSMTRSHEGTGLGLALTKSLVNMHGGDFKISSALGKGTTVIITLPRPDRQLDAA